MATQYGRSYSELSLQTKLNGTQTEIARQRFEIPLSISRPFEMKNGGLKVLNLSSSPGLFEADDNRYRYELAPGTRLEITDPAYTSAFKMAEKGAYQHTSISVGEAAYCKYRPQPIIPYQHSKTAIELEITLANASAKVSVIEIITGGREGMGERFLYQSYQALTTIWQEEKLLYRENLQLYPQQFDITGWGFLESSPHMASIVLVNFKNEPKNLSKARQYIAHHKLRAGISQPQDNLIVAKIFGNQTSKLEFHTQALVRLFETPEDRFD